MTIQSTGKIKILAKNAKEGRERGRLYYNLAVLVGSEAGNLSCTEEAYNNASVNSMNEVTYAYNEQYKSFRIIDAYPARDPEPKRPEPPAEKPDKADSSKK